MSQTTVDVVKFAILKGGDRHALHAQTSDIGRLSFDQRPPFWLKIGPWNYHEGVSPHTNLLVLIDGYRSTDDSGNSWDIHGRLRLRMNPYVAEKHPWARELLANPVTMFHGYYGTNDRKGCLILGPRRYYS